MWALTQYLNVVPLSDANARRSEKFFEDVYRDLYASNKDLLSSDSRRNGTEDWIKQLRIIDSTTITLFSNAIFKGVGRHPKTGKKKGGIKEHSVIHANEGIPCDVQFTSAATNDSFMLAPSHYHHNEIEALDRAYINYAKFEELTERGVVYVTKMKKNLNYEVLVDCMHQNAQDLMEYREQVVVFRKDGMILLWRERQCHKDSDMGHTLCQSATLGSTKYAAKALELLGAGDYCQHCTDVLPESRKVSQSSRCGPENNACRSIRISTRRLRKLMRGLSHIKSKPNFCHSRSWTRLFMV